MMLQPYMRPEVSAAAAMAAAGFGLRGDELRATVEAAEIVAALRALRAAGCYRPQGYRPAPPQHADADVPDLDAEATWLVKVARAYATSPIVYQLVADRP
jgi:predicted signal transduction protein with EAL and GGDEF domain